MSLLAVGITVSVQLGNVISNDFFLLIIFNYYCTNEMESLVEILFTGLCTLLYLEYERGQIIP